MRDESEATMFYMRDVGWGWEFLVGVGVVAFWILLVVGVLWLLRGGLGGGTPPPPAAPSETPIEILDRRLAVGELTVDEYQERRDAIEPSRGHAGAAV